MSPLDFQIQNALVENPFLSGRKLRIELSEGRVTLHGTVKSYYHKQMAQESLRNMAGVAEIENRLEVNWA
jgi:osmotically-inducible protein OsmY